VLVWLSVTQTILKNECAQSAKKFYKEDKMASVFDGLIKEAEFAIRAVKNTIKREQEKVTPDQDRITALQAELADLERQKTVYENNRRDLGI